MFTKSAMPEHTVSKFGRFVAERRASNLIICWARFRIHLLRKYNEQAAVKSFQ